jgi:hypothetical protein
LSHLWRGEPHRESPEAISRFPAIIPSTSLPVGVTRWERRAFDRMEQGEVVVDVLPYQFRVEGQGGKDAGHEDVPGDGVLQRSHP